MHWRWRRSLMLTAPICDLAHLPSRSLEFWDGCRLALLMQSDCGRGAVALRPLSRHHAVVLPLTGGPCAAALRPSGGSGFAVAMRAQCPRLTGIGS